MSLHPGLVPFPQSAAAPAGGAGAAALVRFKAGKLTTEWKSDRGRFLVTPQPEKGEIVLTRGEEGQLLHFQWRNRVSKEVVDDYIVFADCEYKRVDTGRPADRVFMLEWTGRARDKRFFFWMQDKDASKDEERMRSINLHISNPAQAQPSDGGLDWNAFSSVLQQNAQPNAAPDAPPNSETQRLRLEQLQSALSQMEIPAPAPAGSSAEEKAADGGEQGASAAPASSAAAAGSDEARRQQMEILQNFMASQGPRTPPIPLQEVVNGEAINATAILDDEAVVQRLVEHLPEGQQNAEQLRSTLRSPQFRVALAQMSSALQSENYNSVLANLGLSPEPGMQALLQGENVEAFILAVASRFGQQADDEDEQMDTTEENQDEAGEGKQTDN